MKIKRIRQEEARIRSVIRTGRSSEQQIKLLEKRPGQAKKELARLTQSLPPVSVAPVAPIIEEVKEKAPRKKVKKSVA